MYPFRLLLVFLLAFATGSIAADPSPKLPPGVTVRHDLSFLAEGRKEKLDRYQPARKAPIPASRIMPAPVSICMEWSTCSRGG